MSLNSAGRTGRTGSSATHCVSSTLAHFWKIHDLTNRVFSKVVAAETMATPIRKMSILGSGVCVCLGAASIPKEHAERRLQRIMGLERMLERFGNHVRQHARFPTESVQRVVEQIMDFPASKVQEQIMDGVEIIPKKLVLFSREEQILGSAPLTNCKKLLR